MNSRKQNCIIFLLTTTFLLTSIGSINAQSVKKLNKYIEKAEKKFKKNKYEKAVKFTEKLEEKSIGKLGSDNLFLAIAYLNRANYKWALGEFVDFYELHEKALSISENANGASSIGHALNLKKAAENMIKYGNFLQSGEFLKKAQHIFSESSEADKTYLASLDLLRAEIEIGKGNYSLAIEILNSNEKFLLQKALDRSLDRNVIDNLNKDISQMITLKANALRHRGEFLRSDSAFVYGETWIKDKLGKKSLHFSNHLFYFAQMLAENGTKELPANYYKDAYLYASAALGDSHPFTLRNLQSLAINAIKETKAFKTSVYQKQLQKTIQKNLPKTSAHRARLSIVDYEINLRGGRVNNIENEAINLMLNQKNLIADHPLLIELHQVMIKAAGAQNQYANIENYIKKIIELESKLYGDSAVTTSLSRIELANYWVDYTDKFEQAEEIYLNEFAKKVKKELTEGHFKYVSILNHLATSYQAQDNYKEASQSLDKALMLTRIKYDNKDIDFGKELTLISDLQIKIGEYEKADKNLKEALQILENFDTDLNIVYYIKALETNAKLLTLKGFYDEAEEAIALSQKLFKSAIPNPEYNPVTATQELASVYIKIGKYNEAELILNKAIKQNSRQYGEASQKLIDPLVEFGRLQLIKGDYPAAENYARRALSISESFYSKYSTKNIPATLLLGELYEAIGDYDKSEEFYVNAINILENQFGRTHVDVATTISRLAIVQFFNNSESPEKIQNLLFEAKDIIGKRFSTISPIYADLLKDMATFFISQNKLEDAFSFLAQSETIWKNKVGRRNNIKAADIHLLRGDIFYRQKKYGDAEKEYKASQKLNEKFFNNQHPEYVKATAKLSKVYYMDGNEKKAKATIEEVIKTYDTFIGEYFPSLSEREKTKYWNTIKSDYDFYNTIALSSYDKYPEMMEQVYNNTVKTKGLLLNTSIKMRQRILNTTDSTLINNYFEWIEKKEKLIKAIAMSADQLAELGINLSELSKEIELIEKDLSQKSEFFSQGYENQDYNWKQIKGTLKENEVAVEMVRFRHFDHFPTDSIIYIALILKNDKSTKPNFVVLNNGKALESKFFNYYRNSIKYKIRDQYSYKNFWEPLREKIGANNTIYFSPDGVYNQMNLEAIPLTEQTYLIDEVNIILISNTKDLFINKVKTKEPNLDKTALLFGDPKFYVTEKTEYKAEFRGGATQVNELPGTKREIEALTKLLQKNGWNTYDYLELQASEPEVKNLQSPKVFHIATHGFFNEDNVRSNNTVRRNNLNENPLLKSGLMLKGAGDLLAKTSYNFNMEPGILTAYEAMNLNLDKTELVVLSACETGLGEVHEGEGVFGLQRSFLVAGAKTLIMSLFKVSDEATEKLMISFYTKWLATDDKRQAFIDAKKEIREEFKDPIYWGAFVMMGLD